MICKNRWTLLVAFLALPLAAKSTTEDTRAETRSNPTIATPEAAKAQLHSGGIGYTYNMDLPPAAGITPELQLSFSSLTGNTEYGRGWSLNLSKIERSTRTGVPTYTSPELGGDQFELDGALLVQDPTESKRFHLEQTDHRRIVYYPGTGPAVDYWEVTTPDGTKFLYGSRTATDPDANSKLDNTGRQPSVPLGNFRWSLDMVGGSARQLVRDRLPV